MLFLVSGWGGGVGCVRRRWGCCRRADRVRGVMLASWADGLGRSKAGVQGRGCIRFAFYGRVSTEDWQDPVTSRARQLQQAVMLTAGHGTIVAEFFDAGESRILPWTRRPQAAALVASSRTRSGGGTRW
jgi:hypothetical protein